MQRQFEFALATLKKDILTMGQTVEKAIEAAVTGIIEMRSEMFQTVHRLELDVNRLNLTIDESCLRILATQSPVASDLRFVLAVMKINADLERMGDQAVNIAQTGQLLLVDGWLGFPPDLAKMIEEVRDMVRSALDSLMTENAALARIVIKQDDIVDGLKKALLNQLAAEMEQTPKSVQRLLSLVLISRNLERLGDHATNIAEDVIFFELGDDVRHHGLSR